MLTRVLAVWFSLARQILFPMEYAPVFCGTNLLPLDELQVHGEGDGNTEMLLSCDICSENDDSEVVREANSDHSVGGYSIGNNTCLARPNQTARTLVSESKSKCHAALCAGGH